MASGSLFRRPAVMLALALVSVGGVVTLMGHLASGPPVQQKKVQVSTGDASESYPSISPDGKHLAYSGRESSKVSAFHVFVRELPSGKPVQITKGEGNDIAPVWAPDGGTLAFMRIEDGKRICIVIPADGGEERRIAELGPAADSTQPMPEVSWNPDGKSLVVVQNDEKQLPGLATLALDTGKLVRITNPGQGAEGDSTPAVAASGSSIAFVRHTPNDGSDIFLCDATGGGVRRLTFDDKGIRGIAWSRDGQDLIYSSNRASGWRLWRVPTYGGSPREFTMSGRQAYYPTVGRNRLAFTDSPTVSAIWRATLGSEPVEERALIRSTGRETMPVYSPDGAKIANVSDQTGAEEIFVSDANGQNRVQITEFKGPRLGRVVRWSPDGKALLFDVSADHGWEVFAVGAAPGQKPKRILTNGSNASMSRDGKTIYFQMRGEVWKATADGGNPQSMTKDRGAAQPVESVDGKYVYYRSRRGIWRVPVDGGEGEEAFVPEHDFGFSTTIQPMKKGIYYGEFERSSRSMVVSFYDFAAKKSSVVFRMKNSDFFGATVFSVSPDGKYLLYPRVDQSQTNLMLVEGFR